MPPISVIMRRLRQSFVACWSIVDSWCFADRPSDDGFGAVDGRRANRDRAGVASLSVKLLLPTGLCMLPAFVFLGILPSVMAFVG